MGEGVVRGLLHKGVRGYSAHECKCEHKYELCV